MRALALLLLISCAGEKETAPTEKVGETVVRDCGEAPRAPGWGAEFNGDTATMPRADYLAISDWRDQVSAWEDCVVNHP